MISDRIKGIQESCTMRITSLAIEMMEQGRDVIRLSAGEPDFDTPLHVKEAATIAIADGYTKYTAGSGSTQLKAAIAEKLKRDHDLDYATNQIVASCGGKHAISHVLMSLCQEGDEVLVPAPYWVSYPEMIKLTGATPVIMDGSSGNGMKVTAEQLHAHIGPKTKMLILNSPCNPSGTVFSRHELDELADVLERTDIFILSDEVYEWFEYSDQPPASLAQWPALKDRTIVVNSVSKTYAMTGWRIGFLAARREIASACAKLQSQSTSNPTSISQQAAIAALTGDQECVFQMRDAFRKRRDYVYDRLTQIPDLECDLPGGAFYIFPDLSHYLNTTFDEVLIDDDVALCQYLLEECGVAVVPGSAFGAPGHIRISYACSMQELETALDRIEMGLARLPVGE